MFNINHLTERINKDDDQKSVVQKLKRYAHQYGPIAEIILADFDLNVFVNYRDKPDFPLPKFKTIQTESNVCAKILPRKTKGIYMNSQKAFKCHDCIFENNSIMCAECFQDSDHKGHIYEVVDVFGGCCDCGDEEKWNPVGFCKKHSNNNLVQEMQKRVDTNLQQRFIKQIGFCFLLYFIFYDETEREIKKDQSQQIKTQAKNRLEFTAHYGQQLIEHLGKFNNNSLISNIMTFNLLRSKILLKEFQLVFCPSAENKTILQIMLRMIRLGKCAQLSVNLFTQLFTLRQFRKQLTITFMRLHHQSTEFAMSDYNHLTCQLLTSHKMIRQLVESKQIYPLTCKPKQNQVKSFQEMARNLMRYFIDIDYLSKLYKDSAQKYLCYHIMQGEITSIGYYKLFSYLYEQSITYYGVEEVGLNKIAAIMITIKNAPQCLTVLQKGMKDLWAECRRLYKLWNNQLFKQQTYQQAALKNIYITYEMQFGLLVFTYFQKLSQKDSNITQQQKFQKIISVLEQIKNEDKNLQSQILQMLEVVNNNLILNALTLGHPQTMERYYSFYAFTFKKTHNMISCTLYLYKILTKMLTFVRKQQKKSQELIQICQQFIFKRPFNQIENLFVMGEFQDDDQSIFDRKKNLLRITFFLHLLIQASQTDFYELIIASILGLTHKEKYAKMLNKFYLDLLRVYNKSSIKDFKKIVDTFILNDQAFQKFISSSKQILIEHGKISIKCVKQQQEKENQSKLKQESTKVQSELNLFYFKTYKNKLINLTGKQIVFKSPQSQNHFLYEILTQEFVSNLMKLVQAYVDMMVMENGRVKAEQSGTLGLLVIQMIKIGKAFQHKNDSKIPGLIFDYFRNLQHKKTSLSIFPQDIVKIICNESQQSNTKIHETMTSLDKQAQKKAQQRKRKLQEKKKKMVAKFKQNQQKFQQAYGNQLRKIRDEMEEQNQKQMQQQHSQEMKTCIICREGQEKQKFMLMCFMQLTDLYQQFIKGKKEDSPNCHTVFKTCGHYIHEECYKKTNKSQFQEYSMCQLCKSTVNCLFPICVNDHQTQKQEEDKSQKKEIRRKESENLMIEKFNQQKYQQLKATFSYLYAIDFSLRQDCENGFQQPLTDDSEIKFKLLQSLVSQIVFSAIICRQSNERKFYSKQIDIYRNILYALKIFDKGELKESQNTMSIIKQKSLCQQITNIIKNKQLQLHQRKQKQDNKQKISVLQIANQMEKYVLMRICNFLQDGQQKFQFQMTKLTQECIANIDNVLSQLIDCKSLQKQEKQEKFKQCKEVNFLNSQIKFFNAPESLTQLIKMRGKCQNCQNFTNFIQICLICEWKGCKGCHKESVFAHTRNKHCGNSIYLDTDVGNVYFVCKKKFWVYASIYQDYLGESFKAYEQGIKLQRYSLNEHRFDKLRKVMLSYSVQSTIRYEQYSKKRQFTGLI